MKRIKFWGAFLLSLVIILSGCSRESIEDFSSSLLDKMFKADPSSSVSSSTQNSEASDGTVDGEEPVLGEEPTLGEESTLGEEPVLGEPSSDVPEAEEPVIDDRPEEEETAGDASTATQEDVTPSHTDVTLFGPGESFLYVPKGVDGTYACTYESGDEAVASVDQSTGRITAMGTGTTKVKMHVENNGQFDFECIVRCNWKDDGDKPEEEPSLPPTGPSETDEPSGSSEPAGTTEPAEGMENSDGMGASDGGEITASHSDATFFSPQEHFHLMPEGAGEGCVCTYTSSDKDVATVSDAGIVTAVGPGTATIVMTVNCGGTDYIFECIVRCNWE